MRKEDKIERGCLTLDFLAGLGQKRGARSLAGTEDRPQGFWQQPGCVLVTKACAILSLGREEKLFSIVNCAIAN